MFDIKKHCIEINRTGRLSDKGFTAFVNALITSMDIYIQKHKTPNSSTASAQKIKKIALELDKIHCFSHPNIRLQIIFRLMQQEFVKTYLYRGKQTDFSELLAVILSLELKNKPIGKTSEQCKNFHKMLISPRGNLPLQIYLDTHPLVNQSMVEDLKKTFPVERITEIDQALIRQLLPAFLENFSLALRHYEGIANAIPSATFSLELSPIRQTLQSTFDVYELAEAFNQHQLRVLALGPGFGHQQSLDKLILTLTVIREDIRMQITHYDLKCTPLFHRNLDRLKGTLFSPRRLPGKFLDAITQKPMDRPIKVGSMVIDVCTLMALKRANAVNHFFLPTATVTWLFNLQREFEELIIMEQRVKVLCHGPYQPQAQGNQSGYPSERPLSQIVEEDCFMPLALTP